MVKAILSSLVVTAVGVAFIFRIEPVRELVTGIRTAKPGTSAPATGAVLYV